MEEQLILLETAKLAKEKGFDVEVHHCWMITLNKKNREPYIERDIEFEDNFNSEEFEKPHFINSEIGVKYTRLSAPTQSLLQKWLREKHKIILIIGYQYEDDLTPYSYWIYKEGESLPINQWVDDLKTYEQALELGLQEALKLI